MSSPRVPAAVIVVCAAGALLGASAGGFASAPAACAQTTSTLPTDTLIPTLGPIDPACQRVPDTDSDGVFDYEDNCQGYFNPRQADLDNDSGPTPYQPVKIYDRPAETGGDVCDVDDDSDAVPDVNDNCPKLANKDQLDADGDAVGDVCDDTPTAVAAAAGGTPKLSLGRLARSLRVAAIGAGVTVPVRCTAPCALTATLLADAKSARRLGLGSSRQLGTGRAGLDGKGATFVFVRLSASRLRAISRAGRVSALLSVVASGDTGKRSSATRRLVLRR
jgi:hypothetical protein